MMQNFFRNSRFFFSGKSKLARTKIPFGKKRTFTHERLEPRMMMTINPTGTEFSFNDTSLHFQSVDNSTASVAVSDAAGTLATYSGIGVGRRDSIFLSSVHPDGNQAVQLANTTLRGERTAAVVASNELGNTVVAWQGRGTGDRDGIFMQLFDADGAAIGSEQRVNETRGGKQHEPAIAMAANGSFVVTWSGPSSADSAGIFARRYNADGTVASDETLVNSTTAEKQIESAIAMNSDGDYVITWSSQRDGGSDWDISGQLFNAAGVRQGDEFRVNTTTTSTQRESSVAIQDDGTFMAVWSSHGQDGDNWGIVGQRFDATGAKVGSEIVVNTSTLGRQRLAQIAGAGEKYLVTWQSGVLGAGGWEVVVQEFDADGNHVGSEQTVNASNTGESSGHQQQPAAALNSSGSGAVVWSGQGSANRREVFGRSFLDDDPISEDNLAPDLASISDQTVAPNTELAVAITATDPNSSDTLTYTLDPDNSPAGATIEVDSSDNGKATILWTPSDADLDTVVKFRVIVTDSGDPSLADAEEFLVTVSNGRLLIDLNGTSDAGPNAEAIFYLGGGAVPIVSDDLAIRSAQDDMLSRATIQLTSTPDGSRESLAVDATILADTNITATYSIGLGRLLLSGVDTVENYERVLKTLSYNNTSANASGTRTVGVQINDVNRLSAKPTINITIGTADLVGFAQALAGANAQFFGAAWSEDSTLQKELFEDGGQFLPFVDVTNADRTLSSALATPNGITSAEEPTWIFADGTRLEGVQTLATLAAQSGVTIPISDDPFVAPIPDTVVRLGSPLHVSLDGYDPNGGTLSYTVETNNAAVEARILSGNRSARVNVAGYGDMVFELFEGRASRPTDRFIELANDDFYDGIAFHRIIDDFVIQGGDNGTGGSPLDNFDDQFHVDLQHNRSGLLSYAKSTDDTNDSQFFITDFTDAGSQSNLRNLDFNHSVFGVMVEGDENRAAINDTAVAGSTPLVDIVMSNLDIFTDNENAVLFLEATSIPAEDVTVTVTVTDQQGNSSVRTFVVTVQEDGIDNLPAGVADTTNGRPFLGDIVSPISIARNTTASISLTATDVEGDAFVFGAEQPAGNTVAYTFDIDETTGLLEVTPPTDFVGTLEIIATVGRTATSLDDDRQLITIDVT